MIRSINRFLNQHIAVLLLLALAVGFSATSLMARLPQEEIQQDPDWLKFCTSCEQHDVLNALAGRWNATLERSRPGEENTSVGLEVDYQWVLGGRFLLGSMSGYLNGEQIEGRHVLGYDSFRGDFFEIWFTNQNTSFQLARGQYDEKSNQLILKGVNDDVELGRRDIPFTQTITFGDDGSATFEFERELEKGVKTRTGALFFSRLD
ncbi:MAG: DUF1579 family protein [Planctomycetota bacterium]|nr:DUF1579 family protein [Planctomycetota bacterium]